MVIGIILLSPAVQSICNVVISHTGNRIQRNQSCLTVIDCVFIGLSSSSGAAIDFRNRTSEVTINGSSFLSCSASVVGGACYLYPSRSLISRCCGYNCSAQAGGSFVLYYGSTSQHVLDVVGIFSCSGTNEGTFSFYAQMIANVSSLNLTGCNASHGICFSALTTYNVPLTIRGSHFVNNSGESGFSRPIGEGGLGWFFVRCDFFNNILSKGVLSTVLGEMRLNDCHFSGNLIDFDGSSNTTKYWIANSVFSDTFPSTNFVNLSNCTIDDRQE
jgi:hypothetical protein